jgi:hypothetical protein
LRRLLEQFDLPYSERELVYTAYHEAGHAVAHLVTSFGRLELVSVVPNELGRTGCVHARPCSDDPYVTEDGRGYYIPEGLDDGRRSRWAERNLLCTLAGPVAEAKLRHRSFDDLVNGPWDSMNHPGNDKDWAYDLATLYGRVVVAPLSGNHESAETVADRFLRQLWRRLHRLFNRARYWKPVEAIAHRLLEVREISGVEALRLYEATTRRNLGMEGPRGDAIPRPRP